MKARTNCYVLRLLYAFVSITHTICNVWQSTSLQTLLFMNISSSEIKSKQAKHTKQTFSTIIDRFQLHWNAWQKPPISVLAMENVHFFSQQRRTNNWVILLRAPFCSFYFFSLVHSLILITHSVELMTKTQCQIQRTEQKKKARVSSWYYQPRNVCAIWIYNSSHWFEFSIYYFLSLSFTHSCAFSFPLPDFPSFCFVICLHFPFFFVVFVIRRFSFACRAIRKEYHNGLKFCQ